MITIQGIVEINIVFKHYLNRFCLRNKSGFPMLGNIFHKSFRLSRMTFFLDRVWLKKLVWELITLRKFLDYLHGSLPLIGTFMAGVPVYNQRHRS